jgi:ribonuclease D
MEREAMNTRPRIEWVDRPQALDALAADLRSASSIAVDTEQDSFFSYRTKVCLLQIGVPGRAWIVDPLALSDLSALRPALEDPAIPKIVHAGDNDIALLKRDAGIRIRGLFDTMLAASILGYPRTGLAALLDEHFGLKLEKKYQRSDWRKRPLELGQVAYAAEDVLHLERLRDALAPQLAAKDRVDEAESEFARIEASEPEEKEFDPESYFRIEGAPDLDPVCRRVLRDVYVLREEIAKREDRARFRVVGDESLLLLARTKPSDMGTLRRVHGLSDVFLKQHGQRVLELVQAANEAGPLAPPPRKPFQDRAGQSALDVVQKKLFDKLRDWRAARAAERGVEVGRVIPNQLLVKVVLAGARTKDDLKRVGFEAWRLRVWGEAFAAELARLSPKP